MHVLCMAPLTDVCACIIDGYTVFTCIVQYIFLGFPITKKIVEIYVYSTLAYIKVGRRERSTQTNNTLYAHVCMCTHSEQ